MLDVFRVSASADATMATWGGSTVDNLESITEDDDGQRGGTNMEEEEDDGKLVSLWAVRILRFMWQNIDAGSLVPFIFDSSFL